MIRMVKTHNGYQIHEIVCDSSGVPVSSFPAIIQGMTRLDALKYMEDVIDAALEAGLEALTDTELRAKTDEFKSRIAEGETLAAKLPAIRLNEKRDI